MALKSEAATAAYTGDSYNLSKQANKILLVLKETLKTNAFRVVASGDGDVEFSNSGDVLDNDDTSDTGTELSNNGGSGGREYIAGSLNNERAWFIIAPDALAPAQAQLCVQMLASAKNALYLRIKVSIGGFDMTTANASTTPGPITPGDEKVHAGGGTDASPAYDRQETNLTANRVQIVCEDDTDFPYFHCLVTEQGSDLIKFLIIWDFTTEISRHALDDMPYQIGWLSAGSSETCGTRSFLQNDTYIDVSTGNNRAFATAYSTSGATCNNLPRDICDVEGFGANTLDGKEPIRPIEYGRKASSGGDSTGYKGQSKYIGWCQASHGSNEMLNIASATSREFHTAKDLALPWAKPMVDAIK